MSKLQQFSDILQSSTLSHHLSKRNLLDILFSSYSIDQIGETSNRNFKSMNDNFNKMKSFSEKLWHSQNQMAQTIKNLNIDEKKVHYQTLYLEFAQISSNIYELFIYALSQIKKSVKPTRTVNIIFELMTGSQFCELNQCFSAPVFNQINETYLQVTFTKTFQTLKRAIFVSCTIYNDMTVSVYSHSLAFLTKNGTLHFDNKKLSSIPLSFLSNSNIENIRRPISKNDLIQQSIYPIYKNNEVSLQCLNITTIKIQGKTSNCDPFTIQWIPAPAQISIHGKIINFLSESHFKNSIQLYQNNLKRLNSFQENTYVHSTFSKIKNFFSHPSTDLKTASIVSTSVATICLALTCLLCSACCCPSIVTSCLQVCCLCGCKVGSYVSTWLTRPIN